jgi:hypothetical protein
MITSDLFFASVLRFMRPPARPSSKGSSLTRDSSSKADCSFSDPNHAGRARRSERPEIYVTEPPPSSSRTRVARVARIEGEKAPPSVDSDEPPCSSNMTMEAWAAMNAKLGHVSGECVRTRLIGELSRLLREPTMPETTRTAGLTLIGWLARRMPGEAAHSLGVPQGAPREAGQGSGNGSGSAKRPSSDVAPRSARGAAASAMSAADRRPGKR